MRIANQSPSSVSSPACSAISSSSQMICSTGSSTEPSSTRRRIAVASRLPCACADHLDCGARSLGGRFPEPRPRDGRVARHPADAFEGARCCANCRSPPRRSQWKNSNSWTPPHRSRPGAASRCCTTGTTPRSTLAPGTARRRALDAAREEIAAGPGRPEPGLALPLLAHARPRAGARSRSARARQRPDAAPAPGRRAGRHARRADLERGARGRRATTAEADERRADDAEDDGEAERRRATRTRRRGRRRRGRRGRRRRRGGRRRGGVVAATPTRTARTRPRSPRSPRSTIRAPCAATASSIRPPRARPSPPPGSSRPAARSACSSSPTAGCSSTSSCATSRSRATARA